MAQHILVLILVRNAIEKMNLLSRVLIHRPVTKELITKRESLNRLHCSHGKVPLQTSSATKRGRMFWRRRLRSCCSNRNALSVVAINECKWRWGGSKFDDERGYTEYGNKQTGIDESPRSPPTIPQVIFFYYHCGQNSFRPGVPYRALMNGLRFGFGWSLLSLYFGF